MKSAIVLCCIFLKFLELNTHNVGIGLGHLRYVRKVKINHDRKFMARLIEVSNHFRVESVLFKNRKNRYTFQQR